MHNRNPLLRKAGEQSSFSIRIVRDGDENAYPTDGRRSLLVSSLSTPASTAVTELVTDVFDKLLIPLLTL